jgi:hypothetical protein
LRGSVAGCALPLQLQRHHATFFARFLTFAHRFFAAFAIAALPQPTGRAAQTSKQSLATIC